MSWAEEAHWSRGSLASSIPSSRPIEGNIKKLRAEREKIEKKAIRKVAHEGFVSSLMQRRRGMMGRTRSGRNKEAEEVKKLKTKGRKLKKGVKGSEKKSGSMTPSLARASPRLLKLRSP
ncbi:hypothetical protein HAX54_009830 [Datura stramonium]|uniref:Uncharacterized protein n=1 Tax=Datura stramonium TaxID=4076 RepID=A0ABS8WVJ0_DATST|nr:hypothetical protein [Datura stramonium]